MDRRSRNLKTQTITVKVVKGRHLPRVETEYLPEEDFGEEHDFSFFEASPNLSLHFRVKARFNSRLGRRFVSRRSFRALSDLEAGTMYENCGEVIRMYWD